ncbi:MAG: von Willebrand factor type A domain-containing protein [Cyclobacteriaceae bacterium]|nr:von Willebrand factor type A domain-containing protein [Cyclobacteriaceae bacterium]
MTRIAIIIVAFFTIMSFQSVETDRWIAGTVVDADGGSTLPGVSILLKKTTTGVVSDVNGKYKIRVPEKGGVLVFSFVGYVTQEINIGSSNLINVKLSPDLKQLSEVVVTGYAVEKRREATGSVAEDRESAPVQIRGNSSMRNKGMGRPSYSPNENYPVHNTEEYDAINENIFYNPGTTPLSTFSIDVDAASYSNVRRFLNNGQMPQKDVVRIEEMINYFNYDYAQPEGKDPFAVHTEISTAPWNEKHRLVHIGLQGKTIPMENLPPSNLVFLIDVSGSMNAQNKLPLLVSSFKMLVEQLREEDRVAIVVYAGAAGMVLPSTSGAEKATIIAALDKLSAGGSTAGGAGINLAYNIAKENFKKEGNNRIILATDGDFNVGASSNASMQELIEKKREEGVFLTVLGFGMGNYKDSKMEILADKGNGNYAYIDNATEARKVLVNEFGGTLFTIAKDVKLQIEFNPAKVQAYRLIGYENRKLRDEDFNDDKKDAGELGSGHTVTALYEIIPVGVESDFLPVDQLRYQKKTVLPIADKTKELMNIKLRYKLPDEKISNLIEHPVFDKGINFDRTSNNFRWSAAVASFGMLLRDSEFKANSNFESVLYLAEGARGTDKEGYRIEFINMVKSSQLMAKR